MIPELLAGGGSLRALSSVHLSITTRHGCWVGKRFPTQEHRARDITNEPGLRPMPKHLAIVSFGYLLKWSSGSILAVSDNRSRQPQDTSSQPGPPHGKTSLDLSPDSRALYRCYGIVPLLNRARADS